MAVQSGFEELFPNTQLLSKDGPVDISVLEGKYVALYFSASWCGPCQRVTPEIKKIYEKQKELGNNWEIVLISGDKTQPKFAAYYEKMPWLALPFDQKATNANLNKKFKCRGIPYLVLLDPEGNSYSTKGVPDVFEENGFPWVPPTKEELWAEIMSQPFLGKDEEEIPVETLQNKTIGFYFSAHWCGPCKKFTPLFARWYQKNHERLNLEVIFVSSDKEEDQYDDYYDIMPWKALPYEDGREKALHRLLPHRGIPHLSLVDGATGEVLCEDADSYVRRFKNGEQFPWANMVPTFKDNINKLNEMAGMILLQEHSTEEEKSAGEDIMRSLVVEQKEKEEYFPMVANAQLPILAKVRQRTDTGTDQRLIFILGMNIFVAPEPPTTPDDVRAHHAACLAGQIQPKTLRG